MKITRLFLFITVSLFSMCLGMDNEQDWTTSRYLNTKYLENYKQVRRDLKKEGFTEEYFPTEDNILIKSLFYHPTNANKTIIFCAGWIPGRKEGMVSFYPMFKDQNCALLFFDARGAFRYANNSKCIKKIKTLCETASYGEYEYKDILAAIKFAHEKNKKPIYILSVCAGTYHAYYALNHLSEKKEIKKYNVKGWIFDSGWTSFTNASYHIIKEYIDESVASTLYCCGRYHREKNPWFKKMISCTLTPLELLAHALIVRMALPLYAKMTSKPRAKQKVNLKQEWKEKPPTIPVLFIHSHDDPTNIKDIQQLGQCAKNASCWWIKKPSKHTYHNLKHKEEYKEKILAFFKKCE